jgi:hypothetical protein
MVNLGDMVGKKIQACIVFFDAENVHEYTLHGVEAFGIWIGGPSITEYLLEKLGQTMLSKTPVVFVSFDQVKVIFALDEGVQISEKVLQE